jgi:hypothetical protein
VSFFPILFLGFSILKLFRVSSFVFTILSHLGRRDRQHAIRTASLFALQQSGRGILCESFPEPPFQGFL